MYLADTIHEVLDSKKDKLFAAPTYSSITGILNRAFNRCEPFKFKYELYDDYGEDDFSVSGLYDMESEIRYVILNFSKNAKTFTFDQEKWKEFRFAVSQTCQHEAIHKCQWQNRDEVECDKELIDTRFMAGSSSEEREYLSDVDEIDAYAHDIAMEILFFYPKKNPYKVLRELKKHRKIWSYRYFRSTFKGTEWSKVRNRLLKKTFLWLPHVKV